MRASFAKSHLLITRIHPVHFPDPSPTSRTAPSRLSSAIVPSAARPSLVRIVVGTTRKHPGAGQTVESSFAAGQHSCRVEQPGRRFAGNFPAFDRKQNQRYLGFRPAGSIARVSSLVSCKNVILRSSICRSTMQPFSQTIFVLLLNRLQTKPSPQFSQAFVYFFSLLSALDSVGPDYLVSILDAIQPGCVAAQLQRDLQVLSNSADTQPLWQPAERCHSRQLPKNTRPKPKGRRSRPHETPHQVGRDVDDAQLAVLVCPIHRRQI